jgi:hypothetical protein
LDNFASGSVAYLIIDKRFQEAKLKLGMDKDELLINIGKHYLIHNPKSYDSQSKTEDLRSIRLDQNMSDDEKLEVMIDVFTKKIATMSIQNYIEKGMFPEQNEISIFIKTYIEEYSNPNITWSDMALVILPSIISFFGLFTWFIPNRRARSN